MLVDLVWLNKASKLNFSLLGGLEVTKHYFPWGVGGSAATAVAYQVGVIKQEIVKTQTELNSKQLYVTRVEIRDIQGV